MNQVIKMLSTVTGQAVLLLLSFLLVELAYSSVIRPNAEAILEDRARRFSAGEEFVAKRSIYVIVRDYEQETCFILMLWSLSIMGIKGIDGIRQRRLLNRDLFNMGEGVSILPEDARGLIRRIQSLPKGDQTALLPRLASASLLRFEATRQVQDASESANSLADRESERLDSELTMIRYVAWAIPSIGFIGTVRGIGQALSQAYLAVKGDISGITESLGIAFNSTFVALVVSVIVMLCMHQTQRAQERLVIDIQTWCDENLIRNMHSD